MLAGDALSVADADRLRRALHNAETMSGLVFSLYVGDPEEDPPGYAARLHRDLDDPPRSVLVMYDPQSEALEIVVGTEAGRQLDGRACALAAASMQTSFAGGDLVGGLVTGLQQLGEAARAPRVLHSPH